MDLSEKIKILAIKSGVSVQQLAKVSGQSSANLYNKMARNNFKMSELEKIAISVGCKVELNFVMPDGTKI